MYMSTELLHKMRCISSNLPVRTVHGQPVTNYCHKHLSFVATKVTAGDATTEVMVFKFLEAYINL